jgi:hypothetical protein
MFKQVAELQGAFSTEFEGVHTHFIPVPVASGVQPCLIELRQLDGSVKLTDALTVVPRSVRHQVTVDPIYASFLDLIAHEYRKDTADAKTKAEHRRLATIQYSEPPFVCPAQSELRQRIFAVIEELERNPGISSSQRQLIAAAVHSTTSEYLWHPRHLKLGRTSHSRREAWAILARLDEWEMQKPARWNERLVQLYEDLGKPVTRTSQQRGALRKMYAFVQRLVQLEKGALSPLSRMNNAPNGKLPKRRIVL